MAKLADANSIALLSLLGNMSFVKPVLAINAAAAATVRTTNALAYTVGGVQFARAALAAQSIAVTHDAFGNVTSGYVIPAGRTVYLTLGVNAAGTLSVAQGTFAGQVAYGDPAVGVGPAYNNGTSFFGSGAIADTPAGFTAFGVIKIVTGVAGFTVGVTALDVGTSVVSYFDVNQLPVGLL